MRRPSPLVRAFGALPRSVRARHGRPASRGRVACLALLRDPWRAERLDRLEQLAEGGRPHAPGEDDDALQEVAGGRTRTERALDRRERASQIMQRGGGRRYRAACSTGSRARRPAGDGDADSLPRPSRRMRRAGLCGGGALVETRCMASGGGRARPGVLADRRSLARAAKSERRRQLHHAARRDPAQRRRDPRASLAMVAPARRRHRRSVRAVPDGDLRRPRDRSPPVGGALGNRAHAARLRQAARAIGPRPAATTWSASGTARPRRGCSCAKITTSCTWIGRASSSRPIRTSSF